MPAPCKRQGQILDVALNAARAINVIRAQLGYFHRIASRKTPIFNIKRRLCGVNRRRLVSPPFDLRLIFYECQIKQSAIVLLDIFTRNWGACPRWDRNVPVGALAPYV
jgi:hypothetical protein